MSSSIDKRIVEMQFDNAQFEKGISTSLKSLDNLEKGLKLDGATKGLENLGKTAEGMSFDGLQSGIYAVQQKFSALEVIGITALQRITNQAISTGEALVKSLSTDQITAGWDKYGAKTKATQTLVAQGNALEDVNAQMEQLNWFTDETSYNFTDMQENIAKFTATGKGLKESVTAMEGIALWAAASGQNAATASRAMYQLSQAMGAGVMRKEDYKSIQNASMDTDEFRQKCLDAGVALGTLRKNADGTYQSLMAKTDAFNKSQFAEHLTQDMWLTSDVMMEVYGNYAKAVDQIYDYVQDKADAGTIITTSEAIEEMGDKVDAFGLKVFKAGQEARTFDDAIDSVKDAVSTGWMKTFELIFGDAEQSTKLWTDLANDLYEVFAEGGNERNDYLKRLMGEQSDILTAEQWKTVEESTNASDALQKALMDTAKAHGVAIDEMINDQTSFSESLSKGWLTSGILSETLKKFTDDTVTSTETLTAKLDEYKKLATDVIRGDYGNGAARKKALADAGQDYATIQGIVNKMLAGTEITIEDLSEEQLKSVGYTDEQVKALKELAKQAEETGTPLNELMESLNKPSGRDLLVESMSNMLHGLMGTLEAIKTAWSEAFPAPTVDMAYSALEAINKFTKKLVLSDENSEKLKNSLRGLFDAFGIVTDIVGKLANGAMRILNSVMGDVHLNILDYTEAIGKNITSTRKWIQENETLNKVIDKVVDVVTKWVTAMKNWISEHQVVTKIGNGLSKIFSTISTVASKAADAVSKWWKSFSQAPAVQAAIEKFKEIFFDLLEKGKQAIEDLGPKIADFFANFDGFDKLDFSSASSLFSSFADTAGSGLSIVIDKIDLLKTKVTGIGSSIKEKFAPLQGFIEQFQQLASQGLKKFTFGKIMTALTGIGVISALTKLGDALTAVKKSTDGIKDSLVGVLGGVKGVLTSYQKEIQSKSIINIAIAIGILAGSLIALSFVDADKLKNATIALGSLSAVFAGLVVAMGFFTKAMAAGGNKNGLLANGLGILAMAASILMIVGALKQIQNMDLDLAGMLKSLTVIFAIIGELAAGMFVMKLVDPKGSVGSALSLIAYAVALRLVLSVLGKVSEMPLDSIWKSLIKMSVIMEAVALVARTAGKGSLGGAASMLAAVIALKQMLDLMERVTAMPLNTIIKGAGLLGSLMVMMNFLMAGMGTAGANAATAGKSMLMMSAAMYIMVEVIRNLDDMNSSTLVKGISIIGLLSTFMTAMTAVTHFAGASADKAGIAMIAMAGAVAVLSVSLRIMQGLDAATLWRNMGAIASMMAMMAALMVVSKNAKGDFKTIIALAGAVAALAAIMAIMSTMDTESLVTSTVALDSMMGMLALVLAATKTVDAKAIAGIAVITAAIVAIGVVLKKLSEIPNPDSLLPIATSLSEVLLALSAAMKVMGSMSLAGIGTGSLGIIAAIGTITAVLEALGGLMKLDIFSQNLDRAITAMEKIGNALGSFVGGIVGGIGTSVTNSLPKIADNLTKFADGMDTFVTFTKNLPDNFAERVGIIVAGLTDFAKASFIHGINSLANSTVSFDKVGSQLQSLGEAVRGMATATNGVSVERLSASAEAVSSVASILAEVPTSGGLWGDIVGETMSLDDLGSQLESFATAMVSYCAIITGADGGTALDVSAVEKSKAAADILLDLESKAPDVGGLIQAFTGTSNLSDLGSQLRQFATEMVRYSAILTGAYGGTPLDVDAIEKSNAAVTMLLDISNNAPDVGGIVQAFTGTSDLTELGNQLSTFATGIVRYSQILSGGYGGSAFNSAAVTSSNQAVQMIVDMANNLPDDNGFLSFFTGGTVSMSEFATGLTDFGSALVSYGQQCTMLSVVSINDASACIETLIDAFSLVGDINFEAIGLLSDTLNSFSVNTTFTDVFANAAESMRGVGSNLIEAFNQGITENAPSVTENAQTLVDNFVASINTAIGSNTLVISSAIDTMCSTLITNINNKESDFSTAAENLCSAAASAIYNQYDNWNTAGKFLAIGLAEGIRDGKSEVINAAAEVAKAAADKARATLEINSPSKVTYGFGRFFDLGMANGIYDYADQVAKASETISNEAITAAQLIAENIAATMDEDLDYRPTIRPVLDMDDVDSGLSRFNTTFGGRSLNLASSIDRAMKAAPAVRATIDPDAEANQNGGTTNYNFTQNNYSPKALSRIDLYRQTNNQFAMMKERGK